MSSQGSRDNDPTQQSISQSHGIGEAWLRQTHKERLVWDNLLEERSRDLSSHLYNVYTARQRARSARAAEPDDPVTESAEENDPDRAEQVRGQVPEAARPRKRKAVPACNRGRSWIPHSWTAWPLPLPSFPHSADQAPSGIRDSDTSAREELEEVLLALVLRAARSRLSQQPWTKLVRVRAEGTRGVPAGSEVSSDADSDDSGVMDVPDSNPPEIMLDDDYARALLLPSIRNLLVDFDDLLDKLHLMQKAAAYATETPGSKTSSMSARRRSETRPVSSEASVHPENSSRLVERRRPRLLPRTWTSVLSLLALDPPSSFTPISLRSVTRDCEALFDSSLPPEHPLHQLIASSCSSTPLRSSPPEQSLPALLGRNLSTRGAHRNPHLSESFAVAERLRGTAWTEAEDRELGRGVDEGWSFSRIAGSSELLMRNGRTRAACKGRWRTIERVRARALKGIGLERGNGVTADRGLAEQDEDEEEEDEDEDERWGGVRRDGFLQLVSI